MQQWDGKKHVSKKALGRPPAKGREKEESEQSGTKKI